MQAGSPHTSNELHWRVGSGPDRRRHLPMRPTQRLAPSERASSNPLAAASRLPSSRLRTQITCDTLFGCRDPIAGEVTGQGGRHARARHEAARVGRNKMDWAYAVWACAADLIRCKSRGSASRHWAAANHRPAPGAGLLFTGGGAAARVSKARPRRGAPAGRGPRVRVRMHRNGGGSRPGQGQHV